MAALCPRCGRQFDATLFQFGHPVRCPCGEILYAPEHTVRTGGATQGGEVRGLLPSGESSDPEGRAAMEELAREADRVATRIKDESYSRVDIIVAISLLRERCLELFPDREDLFSMIYESRFARLWEQFRGGNLWEEESRDEL